MKLVIHKLPFLRTAVGSGIKALIIFGQIKDIKLYIFILPALNKVSIVWKTEYCLNSIFIDSRLLTLCLIYIIQ